MKKNTQLSLPSFIKTKYNNIIIPVLLMLIIISSVLGGIYWLSGKINKFHTSISYVSKQTTNVQNLKNSVYNIDLYTQELRYSLNTATEKEKGLLLEKVRYELSALQTAKQEINTAIYTLIHGGNINLNGEKSDISALKTGKLKVDIDKANEYWQPYQRLINSFQKTLDTGAINSETIRFASDYARIFSDNLYYEFDDIGLRLLNEVDQLNVYMQLTMIAGLIISILLFAYIILVAIRQLSLKDAALELARQETTDIMRTVKDGLFLVYPDYRISHEYSSQLSSIIKQENIGGQLLHDLMANIVSNKDIEMTEEFIEQLFNVKVVEDLIDDLNPLDKIKVILTDKKGISKSHYLSFKFSRVYEGKKISRVLVSVQDITEAFELEQKLEKERRQHDEELEMLASILHTDPVSLDDFIRNAQNKTEKINSILKGSTDTGAKGLKDKADQIFREVHSLKGEASALKLSNYVSLMEHFEHLLREMRENAQLTGNDFLPLVVDLDQLIEFNGKIKQLNQSLRQKSVNSSEDKDRTTDIKNFFNNFANDIASRNQRKVRLICQGFEHLSTLQRETQDTLKDLIIQLLRNAIVHGIETPEKRKSLGKIETGQIQIQLELQDDGQLLLTIQDDGHGIDYQSLRQKAVAMKAVRPEDANSMSHKELVKFMLLPGVSTMKNANEDAGQGVGSDIIVANVKTLKGKLGVFSQVGTFTRFSIVFPKK